MYEFVLNKIKICYLYVILYELFLDYEQIHMHGVEQCLPIYCWKDVQWKAWTLLMVSHSYAFLLLSEYTGLNAMLHYIAIFIILFNWGCHYTTGILLKRSIKSQRLKDVTRKTMLWCLWTVLICLPSSDMLCALPYAQVGRIGSHEQNAMKDIVVYFVGSRRGSRKCFKGGSNLK